MSFNLSDRVRLININDPDGTEYVETPSNTVGNVGNISEIEANGWYQVEWDNGTSNHYHLINLEPEGTMTPTAANDSEIQSADPILVISLGNQWCIPAGEYKETSRDSEIIKINSVEDSKEFYMPLSGLDSDYCKVKINEDAVINKALDEATVDRPERSMVEYSLSVNRDKLAKVENREEFPNRDWSKSSSKDQTLIARLRVKGFSCSSIAEASGIDYQSVVRLTNEVLKPQV